MKLKLKSTKLETLDKKIYELISEGWKVIRPPKKNWLGKWICKLEKI